jgi:hypothetical protein
LSYRDPTRRRIFDFAYHRRCRDRILERKRRTYWNKPGERARVLAIRKKHDAATYQRRRRGLHTNKIVEAMIEDTMIDVIKTPKRRKPKKKKKAK